MTIAMEKILAWKLMPRIMMLVMTIMYIRVIEWFMSLPQDVVSTQATALHSHGYRRSDGCFRSMGRA